MRLYRLWERFKFCRDKAWAERKETDHERQK